MFAASLRRQLAAILCTVLMSSVCVLGAVGPATTDAAAIARPVA